MLNTLRETDSGLPSNSSELNWSFTEKLRRKALLRFETKRKSYLVPEKKNKNCKRDQLNLNETKIHFSDKYTQRNIVCSVS